MLTFFRSDSPFDSSHKHALRSSITFFLNHRRHLSCLFRSVFVLHVLVHINVNACAQKFLLRSLGGVCLSIPKLGCKSICLSCHQNVVLLLCACRWL